MQVILFSKITRTRFSMASTSNTQGYRPLAESNASTVVDGVVDIFEGGVELVGSFWSDFQSFLAQSSAIELGIGVLVSTVFNTLLSSVLSDLLMPPVGALIGESLHNIFFVLKPGKTRDLAYATPEEARHDGAITVNLGPFLDNLLKFFLVSLILYWIIKTYTAFKRNFERRLREQRMREKGLSEQCPYCLEMVREGATRCPHCTSVIKPLPGLSDAAHK